MSPKIDNLGVCSIDSLKLRFEVPDLNTFDKSILDHLVIFNNTTGEVEDDYKRKSKKYQCKEYSFHASYSENVRVTKTRYANCITVLINSKHTKADYFKGITLTTIKAVYDEVISLGIIDCSYETFLNGAPTDIDFKKDWILEMDEYKELISACATMTKESSNRDKGCTPFREQTNYGIAWSTRQSNKYLTNPYLKIYHKGIELKHHSIDFYNEYLSTLDVKNVIRIETTVKNKKHLRSLNLNLKEFTLLELLSLTDEQKNSTIAKAVNSHLAPRTKALTFRSKKNMSPDTQIILQSILVMTTELNWSISQVENVLLANIDSKVSRSRKKAKINELYNDYIKGTDYDFKSNKINSFFDAIGWY